MADRMRSFDIPFLPGNAPALETPSEFKLELFDHQKRALHRMCSIERDDKFLKEGFQGKKIGTFLDYDVKGGCLCEPVGMGKSAEILALILSEPRDPKLGPNLLVGPTHLLDQWTREAHKFCKEGSITVITGLQEFQDIIRSEPETLDNRTLVIVDAKSVIKSKRVIYNFRRLFRSVGNSLEEIALTPEQVELFRSKAVFMSPGYKGTMYGWGGPKEQALFFPHLLLGNDRKGFRRVIFDEIQDLVEEGREEKDCLLQLTQHTRNVWLVTATPFPAHGKSVYANHQLLGFKRLRLFCESNQPLPPDSPFEILKRKLYIRSPETVRKSAITAEHTVEMVQFSLSPIEAALYRTQLQKANMSIEGDDYTMWDEHFKPIRSSLSHVGASESIRIELREISKSKTGSYITQTPTAHQLAFNFHGGMVGLFKKICEKRSSDLEGIKYEIEDLRLHLIPALEDSVKLAKYLISMMHLQTSKGRLNQDSEWIKQTIQTLGIQAIRNRGQEKKQKKQDRVILGDDLITKYVFEKLRDFDVATNYLIACERMLQRNSAKRDRLVLNLPNLRTDLLNLRGLLDDPRQTIPRYGSKIEVLIGLLKNKIPNDEQVIIFCSFADVQHIIQKALHREDFKAISLEGNAEKKGDIITSFVTKQFRILVANLEQSASGTNLQVARNVIFVDLPGQSESQAAAQVIQATGRVLRMGQEAAVKIFYMIANNTIEVKMAQDLIRAMESIRSMDEDSKYTCETRPQELNSLPKTDVLVYEGVEVVKRVTLEEKLSKALKAASEKGEVVELLSDGEDEDDAVGMDPAASSSQESASTDFSTIKVKPEPMEPPPKKPRVESL